MTTEKVYTLIESETPLILGSVLFDVDTQLYHWETMNKTGPVYPTAEAAWQALGEMFANVPAYRERN